MHDELEDSPDYQPMLSEWDCVGLLLLVPVLVISDLFKEVKNFLWG